MKPGKRLKGIGEYYFSQKLREIEELNRQGKNIINLGIGSPDLPPHPDVINTLKEESSKDNTHAYQSYKGSPVLREAISKWYQQWYRVSLDPTTEILPLIGSKEGILHICMAFLNKGDRVLVPDPGYPTYSAAVSLAGGKPVTYSLKSSNQFEPDLNSIPKDTLRKTKLMFINYPHMPTGRAGNLSLFRRLVEFADKNDILLVHDNPYSFILNNDPTSLLEVEGAKAVAIELNSLSKSHNMAGWRVGMLCGAAGIISEVLRFKSNMDSGMFLPIQLAAAKALSLGKEWYDELNHTYASRREKVFALLDETGCTFDQEQSGLFVWAGIPKKYKTGYEFSDQLLQETGVFITPGGVFGKNGKKYIRVSLCASKEKLEEAGSRIQQHRNSL
jgi:aspartate/methionine/tyrosine aminotransferase